MNKHSQLTLMIIIGLILLIAVAITLSFTTKTITRRTEPEAGQQRLRQIAVQSVKDYIQSCLDLTTTKALELLGKQGGVLYQGQGGLTPDISLAEKGLRFAEYENLNVSYVILPPTGNIGEVYFSDPPQYPTPTFPYVFSSGNEEIVAMHHTGYFGIPKLAPLLKPGADSIQEQLELFISYQLPKCTDWKTFATQGLEISSGTANASVLIAENITQIETEKFFSVDASWPVAIKDLTTGGETIINQFSLGYPVHFARFYLFVQNLVVNEVSNASFNPRAATSKATPVFVVENVYSDENGGDDIIVVQDAQSLLRGKPLEFRILRKNRVPALVWINQTDLNKYKFVPTGTCNLDAKNIFLDAEVLKIRYGDPADWAAQLKAVDPDEDEVQFFTKPATPLKINVQHAGQDYYLEVHASDTGKMTDYQTLAIKTEDCPTP